MIGRPRQLRALLALDLFALLCAISFATVTASGPAERALSRGAAILIEVDTYIDEHFTSLQQDAALSADERLTLPDYPLDVTFSPDEVRRADRERFRALLLERSGAFLRDHGMSAFGDGDGGGASPAGGIRAGMDLLRPLPHAVFLASSVVLGLAAAALMRALVRASDLVAGLRSIGLVASISSAAFLLLAIAVWLVFWLAASATDEYLANEFFTLARDLAWAPIRDGLIVMVGSAAIAGAGVLLGRADGVPSSTTRSRS